MSVLQLSNSWKLLRNVCIAEIATIWWFKVRNANSSDIAKHINRSRYGFYEILRKSDNVIAKQRSYLPIKTSQRQVRDISIKRFSSSFYPKKVFM